MNSDKLLTDEELEEKELKEKLRQLPLRVRLSFWAIVAGVFTLRLIGYVTCMVASMLSNRTPGECLIHMSIHLEEAAEDFYHQGLMLRVGEELTKLEESHEE